MKKKRKKGKRRKGKETEVQRPTFQRQLQLFYLLFYRRKVVKKEYVIYCNLPYTTTQTIFVSVLHTTTPVLALQLSRWSNSDQNPKVVGSSQSSSLASSWPISLTTLSWDNLGIYLALQLILYYYLHHSSTSDTRPMFRSLYFPLKESSFLSMANHLNCLPHFSNSHE